MSHSGSSSNTNEYQTRLAQGAPPDDENEDLPLHPNSNYNSRPQPQYSESYSSFEPGCVFSSSGSNQTSSQYGAAPGPQQPSSNNPSSYSGGSTSGFGSMGQTGAPNPNYTRYSDSSSAAPNPNYTHYSDSSSAAPNPNYTHYSGSSGPASGHQYSDSSSSSQFAQQGQHPQSQHPQDQYAQGSYAQGNQGASGNRTFYDEGGNNGGQAGYGGSGAGAQNYEAYYDGEEEEGEE